jgi:hypothetical protein
VPHTESVDVVQVSPDAQFAMTVHAEQAVSAVAVPADARNVPEEQLDHGVHVGAFVVAV